MPQPVLERRGVPLVGTGYLSDIPHASFRSLSACSVQYASQNYRDTLRRCPVRTSLLVAFSITVCLVTGIVGAIHASDETRFRCVNGLGNWDIHRVYFSPTSSSDWGEDQLRSDQILNPGEYETWTISADSWDFRAIDEDGDTYRRLNVCVSEGMTVEWTVTLSERDVE